MTTRETAKTMAEGFAIHAISAAVVSLFFRWQGSTDNFWQAGDESLMANGFTGLMDLLYWLFKPRIMRWRRGK